MTAILAAVLMAVALVVGGWLARAGNYGTAIVTWLLGFGVAPLVLMWVSP